MDLSQAWIMECWSEDDSSPMPASETQFHWSRNAGRPSELPRFTPRPSIFHGNSHHNVHAYANERASLGSYGSAYIGGAHDTVFYFVLDSGCSHHMSNLPAECFSELTSTRVVISTGNGKITAHGKGKLHVRWKEKDGEEQLVILHDVLRIPQLPANLLSVGKLCDKRILCEFDHEDACLSLSDSDGSVVAQFTAERDGGLYSLPFTAVNMPPTATNFLAASESRDNVYRIHNSLNHMPLRKMKEKARKGVLDNMLSRKQIRMLLDFSLDEFNCDACVPSPNTR